MEYKFQLNIKGLEKHLQSIKFIIEPVEIEDLFLMDFVDTGSNIEMVVNSNEVLYELNGLIC